MSTRTLPRLLAISDRQRLGAEGLPGWFRRLARAGVDGVQVREKDLPDREVYAIVVEARAILPRGCCLMVNGRLDVALAAGADGVHLPGDGLPIAALRGRFGERPVIGRSTHRLDEVRRARDEGADYVTFGPVYPTPGKEGFGPPQGLAALARACREGIGVFALGGVGAQQMAEVAAAGAAGVAGIRLFLAARLEDVVGQAHTLFPTPRTDRKEET